MKFLKSVFVLFVVLVTPAFAQMTYTQPTGPQPADIPLAQTATVVSVTDVPQYTYIEAKQGDKTVWLAATTVTGIKKGDTIRFSNGMEMKNFHSKALNKDFASIFFVDRVAVAN